MSTATGERAVGGPLPKDPFALRPPAHTAERFRARGWWRDTSIVHDLLSTAAERPDDPAVIVSSAEEGRMTVVRYAELAAYVRRFTAALISLGVRRGDRVAFQLPNRWETAALTYACAWRGAVAVPLLPTMRALELEQMLAASRAQVCVVPDSWDGYDCAAALAEVSVRLPWLRQRVVHGSRPPQGAIDFAEYFLHTPHEERVPTLPLPSGADLDRVCVMLFTSGTTGHRKAVLHTENTLYAGCGGAAAENERGWAAREVFSTPHYLTGSAGLLYGIWGPVLAGGIGAHQDVWSPHSYLELLSAAAVTQTFMAPAFARDLLAEQARRSRVLPALRFVLCGGAPIRPHLVQELNEGLSVPVRSCWGMTEAGMCFRTREDDPCGWAQHSDGSALPGIEQDLPLVPGGRGERRLLIRGTSVAVGYWQPGTEEPLHETWRENDGWVDTGDLVREDGRGGIRFAGRGSRRVGEPFAVPVTEVEREILRHPGVRETAVVGYEDAEGTERLCAVVVSRDGRCPTLAELVGILTERGMTRHYLPDRLVELSEELPKTENGKIRYGWLKAMLVESTEDSADDRAPRETR